MRKANSLPISGCAAAVRRGNGIGGDRNAPLRYRYPIGGAAKGRLERH